jgi:hypothetical protein
VLPHTSIAVSEDVGVLLELTKLRPLIVTGELTLLAKFAPSSEVTLTSGAAHPAQPISGPHMTLVMGATGVDDTIEAELPRQSTHNRIHAHRHPHRRTAVHGRRARRRRRRRPCRAAACAFRAE